MPIRCTGCQQDCPARFRSYWYEIRQHEVVCAPGEGAGTFMRMNLPFCSTTCLKLYAIKRDDGLEGTDV